MFTAVDFLVMYPEFGTFATGLIDMWLEQIAVVYCPDSIWVDPIRRKMAVFARTAHQLETQRQQMAQSASIGAAVSEGESVSLPQTIELDLDQTVYGRQFKQLRATLPTTGFAF